MSSVHCVVVWEWQHNGQWLPHTPGVTRILERSHAKKLTRVVLADADPALKGHYVNLRTLTQCLDTAEGVTEECRVRRSCYSVTSPAGRGLRWEWAQLVAPPLGGELHYEPLPMEVQSLLEGCVSGGCGRVWWGGWCWWAARGSARAEGGALALLRRAHHPPYPLARQPPLPEHGTEGRRPRIPQQHTGSSVHSVQSIQSVQSVQSIRSIHSTHSAQSTRSVPSPQAPPLPRHGGARSASPRDRKPGLARQILHNLNIFNHNSKQSCAQVESQSKEELLEERHTDTECSSTRSGRRHSVDTVSTYLSHESKESLQQATVGELLNCSGGSDDVFDVPPALPPPNIDASDPNIGGCTSQVESSGVWRCVVAESCPQWGALCPACLAPLERAPAVALRACRHLLHLHCVREHLDALAARHEPLYIECLVCGRVYDEERVEGGEVGGEREEVPRAPAPAPLAPQPPGSMAWTVQPTALPQHPHCTSSILVTYNFQSGRQGPHHPVPGAPYYAVGFPRHTLLPDTPLGREVLSMLRVAWERGVLFTVSTSQTTGREHVVAWRVPPPPAAHHHYTPPAHPDTLLRHALRRLSALL